MEYCFRILTAADEAIVWNMLMIAAHEPTVEAMQSQATLAPYAAGWGRAGDGGFVALVQDQPVGAIWFRLATAAEHGFGYIDDATPELAIAVLPHHQGRGLGGRLLALAIDHAQCVYPAISLSVRADNPAVRLYERFGFEKVIGSEKINRVGGVSFNMIRNFIDQ